MPTKVGPGTYGQENLVFALDQGHFPQGWNVTQKFPDSEMKSTTVSFGYGNSFYSGYYLGEYTAPVKNGTTLIFSGGDLSNYYTSNPEWRGWDAGSIGSTGGNWLSSAILPNSADTSRDFIVECKWRFKYVRKSGNGSANPTFQIGRAYTQLYSKTFYNVGSSYDWQYARFRINGADGGSHNTNTSFTFGVTSADAAIEIKYMRVYEINKTSGLSDFTGNSSANLTNVSFDSEGKVLFDGTNDYMNLGDNSAWDFGQNGTLEMVVKPTNSTGNNRLWCIDNNASNLDAYLNGSGYNIYLHGNTVGTTTPLTQNQWNHVAVTYTNGTVQIYINGEPGTMTGTTTGYNITNNSSNNSNLYLGCYRDLGYNLYGSIDLFKIYDKSLTSSEIELNYKAVKSRFNI